MTDVQQDSDPSQRSYSWGEIADLTHATQVATFGWCACEDPSSGHRVYDDCPEWVSDDETMTVAP